MHMKGKRTKVNPRDKAKEKFKESVYHSAPARYFSLVVPRTVSVRSINRAARASEIVARLRVIDYRINNPRPGCTPKDIAFMGEERKKLHADLLRIGTALKNTGLEAVKLAVSAGVPKEALAATSTIDLHAALHKFFRAARENERRSLEERQKFWKGD